jgi:hypothetical protein
LCRWHALVLPSFCFAGTRVMCDEQRKSFQLYHTSHAAGHASPHQPPTALYVCTRDGMYNSCRRTDNGVRVPSPSSLLYTR